MIKGKGVNENISSAGDITLGSIQSWENSLFLIENEDSAPLGTVQDGVPFLRPGICWEDNQESGDKVERTQG